LTGLPVAASAVAIVTVFFAIRYLFASNAAHTTAALPAFLAVLASVPGMPVKAVALTLVYSIGLMGVLTPYATGPAPVWYGAGYIGGRDFWKLGFVMGALYLGTVLAVGLPTAMRFMR
jgi:di/tricarboxylate transporter